MPFFVGTGIILLIIVCIGFLNASKFSSLASAKGYSAKKAKRYPWVIVAVTFTLMLFGQMILSFFTPYEVWLGWGLFTVLLMVTVLRKAYRNMQLAPDKDEFAKLQHAEKLAEDNNDLTKENPEKE
jgi:purine-cytosine permease-like protein